MGRSKMVICYYDLHEVQINIVHETLLGLGVHCKKRTPYALPELVLPRTHMWAVWLARRVPTGLIAGAIKCAAVGEDVRDALKTVVQHGDQARIADFIRVYVRPT